MAAIGKEATLFVGACEGIQSLLACGGLLTVEDRELIEPSAIDLTQQAKRAETMA
jgi:hypothetical protein